MNNAFGSTPSKSPSPSSVSPFARAMAEARGGQGTNDSLSKSLQDSHTGNSNVMGESGADMDPAEQQRLMLEQQKRERLRQQLHRQVNPVEMTDIFNAREQKVKQEIEQIRYELKLLAQEIMQFHKEVEMSVMANVASPGQDGKYHLTFFQQLRAMIVLLRQQVHSARTWATTAQSKKRKRKGSAGIEISGKSHEQTANVFDRMHHEVSTVYSGS